MNPGLNHDHFEVINGPEDGSLFHLVRSPVDLGTDAQCGVRLQLDREVFPLHARVTAASNGYRIRSLEGQSFEVNGKNVGVFRSHYLRSGDVVRLGQTKLALFCAEDGLARRTQGVKRESDFRWALYLLRRKLVKLLSAPERRDAPPEDSGY